MTASNRDQSIRKTLTYEGGYCNDKGDPGGPTKYGITIYDVRLYVKANATAEDVKALTLEQAIQIDQSKYWAKMGCDHLPDGVDFATFDYGVHSGVGRATRVRLSTQVSDTVVWTKAICRERLSFLKHLKTFSIFGKGWSRRVADVEAVAVKMALKGQGKAPEEVSKKLTQEATKAAKDATAGSVAGTGTVAIPTTQLPLEHMDLTTKIGIAIVVLAVLGFLAWHTFHSWQRAAAYKAVAKAAA